MPTPPIPEFVSSRADRSLGSNQIHVWRIPLDKAIDEVALSRLLSGSELQQWKSFTKAQHRRRFLVRRAARRVILARYIASESGVGSEFKCDVAPKEIRFVQADNGKPKLDSVHGSILHFSASHSNELALLGVSLDPLGIDIEFEKPMDGDLAAVAQQTLTQDEYQAWSLLDQVERQHSCFYQYWTCKEAALKTTGLGLSKPMSSIQVEPKPGSEAASSKVRIRFDETELDCRLFSPAEAYIAAVSAQTSAELKFFEGWDST